MKLVRAIGLVSTACVMAAGGVWMGCGGDDSSTPGVDAGGKDTSVGDGGGDPDTSVTDSSTKDSSPKADSSIAYDCNYCNAIATICTGANQQYLDTGTCMKMCAQFAPGDAGTTSGNSLACRVYHATAASADSKAAAFHCPHAGPYGMGQCGGECEDFCALYVAECGQTSYGAVPACVTTCNSFGHSDGGVLDPTKAPTINCREYHLENAYETDAGGGHCDHAGQSGGMVCQ